MVPAHFLLNTHFSYVLEGGQAWINNSRGGGGGGLGLGGPRRKGSPSVLKGPKPPIQLLQMLKNSQREVKMAHVRYILGPPGSTQEMELMGPGGKGPSRSEYEMD